MNLDSSIMISHLSGDIHKDDVLATIERFAALNAELFLSLICYAEIWTGIELLREEDEGRLSRPDEGIRSVAGPNLRLVGKEPDRRK